MRIPSAAVALLTFGMSIGMLAPSLPAGQAAPAGKLVLFGDLNAFGPPSDPNSCTLRNRYKKGETVGFRVYAVDGASAKPEVSAQVVVHVNYGGKTYDLPALYRGIPQKTPNGGTMPVHEGMWTAKWVVPADAATGTVDVVATAKDKFGRTAEWKPGGGEPSFLTIVP